MTYSVKIAPAAERQLRKFDPQVRRRVQAAIDLLARDPRPPKAIQLVGGSGEWRVRTGGYRITLRNGLRIEPERHIANWINREPAPQA